MKRKFDLKGVIIPGFCVFAMAIGTFLVGCEQFGPIKLKFDDVEIEVSNVETLEIDGNNLKFGENDAIFLKESNTANGRIVYKNPKISLTDDDGFYLRAKFEIWNFAEEQVNVTSELFNTIPTFSNKFLESADGYFYYANIANDWSDSTLKQMTEDTYIAFSPALEPKEDLVGDFKVELILEAAKDMPATWVTENAKLTGLKLSYDLDGGEGDFTDNNDYTEGDTIELSKVVPSKPGFKFLGWEFNGNIVDEVTFEKENIIVKAKWEYIKATGLKLSYDLDGGEGDFTDNNDYTEGDTIELSKVVPTKPGFEFLGWEYNGSLVNEITFEKENITVKAKWEYIKATGLKLSYDLDGGNGDFTDNNDYTEGDTIELSKIVPSKTGFKFLGWEFNGNIVDEVTFEKEDITVTAKWEYIKATGLKLSYDLDGGNGDFTDENEYTEGDTIELTKVVPTKSGFEFLGWEYNDSLVSEVTFEKENVTVKARWKRIEELVYEKDGKTITFKGGSVDGLFPLVTSKPELDLDDEFVFPNEAFRLDGYILDYWTLDGEIYKDSYNEKRYFLNEQESLILKFDESGEKKIFLEKNGQKFELKLQEYKSEINEVLFNDEPLCYEFAGELYRSVLCGYALNNQVQGSLIESNQIVYYLPTGDVITIDFNKNDVYVEGAEITKVSNLSGSDFYIISKDGKILCYLEEQSKKVYLNAVECEPYFAQDKLDWELCCLDKTFVANWRKIPTAPENSFLVESEQGQELALKLESYYGNTFELSMYNNLNKVRFVTSDCEMSFLDYLESEYNELFSFQTALGLGNISFDGQKFVVWGYEDDVLLRYTYYIENNVIVKISFDTFMESENYLEYLDLQIKDISFNSNADLVKAEDGEVQEILARLSELEQDFFNENFNYIFGTITNDEKLYENLTYDEASALIEMFSTSIYSEISESIEVYQNEDYIKVVYNYEGISSTIIYCLDSENLSKVIVKDCDLEEFIADIIIAKMN